MAALIPATFVGFLLGDFYLRLSLGRYHPSPYPLDGPSGPRNIAERIQYVPTESIGFAPLSFSRRAHSGLRPGPIHFLVGRAGDASNLPPRQAIPSVQRATPAEPSSL
jgi:hypothetical protein